MQGSDPAQMGALVVEDDEAARMVVARWLERDGYRVTAVDSAEEGLSALARSVPDVICLDIELPGIDGLAALEKIRASHPSVPVILITATATPSTIVAAIQRGAFDYLVKPLDSAKVLSTVRNAAERYRASLRFASLEREAADDDEYEGMVGRSAAMRALFGTLDRVADRDVTVLIHGESGAGKELVARAIHARSPRKKGPFVALNCAAVPESLQEAELFGHEKGAYTGATARRQGYFERADGGTLFLDEVAELAPRLQAQLLRVIEERSFSRIGGSEVVRSSFRLVVASHEDLAEKVRAGKFREDLYFRIAVFDVELPPLRARGEDVTLLAERFVRDCSGGKAISIAQDARIALRAYSYPGNVRELRNAIERALVVCEGGEIKAGDLPSRIRGAGDISQTHPSAPSPAAETPLPPPQRTSSPTEETMDAMERRMLEDALERTGWNVAAVVKQLGMGRTTVYRKIKEYGLVQKR